MEESWLQSEKLNIQHVREPGERMPITCVKGAEGPGGVLPGQAAKHARIVGNVLGVVVENEVTPEGRRKNKNDAACQNGAA